MKKQNQGFTLIELLAVVTILGILAAIAIANFSTMQDRGRIARVKSNMHTTQLSIEDFSLMNGRYPGAVADFLTMLPRLSGGGNGFENPFTGSQEPPVDNLPTESGKIGFTAILQGASPVSYSIHGYGRDALVDLSLTPGGS